MIIIVIIAIYHGPVLPGFWYPTGNLKQILQSPSLTVFKFNLNITYMLDMGQRSTNSISIWNPFNPFNFRSYVSNPWFTLAFSNEDDPPRGSYVLGNWELRSRLETMLLTPQESEPVLPALSVLSADLLLIFIFTLLKHYINQIML